jgi:hypothetical protein
MLLNVYKIMVVPILLHVCEDLTVMKWYDRGTEMVDIIFVWLTARHTLRDHK